METGIEKRGRRQTAEDDCVCFGDNDSSWGQGFMGQVNFRRKRRLNTWSCIRIKSRSTLFDRENNVCRTGWTLLVTNGASAHVCYCGRAHADDLLSRERLHSKQPYFQARLESEDWSGSYSTTQWNTQPAAKSQLMITLMNLTDIEIHSFLPAINDVHIYLCMNA